MAGYRVRGKVETLHHTSGSSRSDSVPKIPGVSEDQAVRALKKAGFVILRQGKHVVMSNGVVRLTIPRHNPINAYTMGAIAADAGLSPEEFKVLLR